VASPVSNAVDLEEIRSDEVKVMMEEERVER
jgi:hypothetical protein